MSNILMTQIDKIISENNFVILILANKESLIQEYGKEKYISTIKDILSDFLSDEEFKMYKKITINSDKYPNELKEYLFGISSFPIIIIFNKSKPKFIVPFLF